MTPESFASSKSKASAPLPEPFFSRPTSTASPKTAAFAEFTEVYQIQADFKAKVEGEFDKMIAKATQS